MLTLIYARMITVIKMKKLAVYALTALLLVTGIVIQAPNVQAKTKVAASIHKKDLDKLSLTGIDRVMFVAHPDDETIWAGNHIRTHKYLIICITNGNNKKRMKEFKAVMKKTGNSYIMLKYPDKTNGKRDNWNTSRDAVKQDIKTVLDYKQWSMIVTHNPKGEYGHIHHKMTSQMVTEECLHKKLENRLMYFGKYYKKKNIGKIKDSKHLSKKQLKQKNDLFKPYQSQMKVKDHLYHMFPYENWISYKKWHQNKKTSVSNLLEFFCYMA